MATDFKPPKRTPTRLNHLQRLADEYGRAHGIAADRARRWLSIVAFAGTLESVALTDEPRFLIKGGTSMELRLGLRARTTKDVDVVFRGDPEMMLDALEEAFELSYGSFSFRRKGLVEEIRDTGSRRLQVQVEFAEKPWQTLRLEVARPEADEPELVPVALSIADFKLESPERVACLYWDLIDLILLRELLGGELFAVRKACEETFQVRGKHTWPPELDVPAGWREPYAATAAEIEAELPEDVEDAAEEVRTLIAEIEAAVRGII